MSLHIKYRKEKNDNHYNIFKQNQEHRTYAHQ
jgi:hypothetical protein